MASLMLASGQSRRAAFVSSAILGGATLLGMGLMFAAAQRGGGCAAVFGGRDALRGGVGSDPRSEPRAGVGMAVLVFLGVAIMLGLKALFHL